MINKPWEKFKADLLALELSATPIIVNAWTTINDQALFLKSHIAVIDSFPKKDYLSNREKNARLFIAKPHYDRLVEFYLLKTQL